MLRAGREVLECGLLSEIAVQLEMELFRSWVRALKDNGGRMTHADVVAAGAGLKALQDVMEAFHGYLDGDFDGD
jgi:hypothetical protein